MDAILNSAFYHYFRKPDLYFTDTKYIVEPSGDHAILSGTGGNDPILEYLPENYSTQDGDKVYTSGKEGIFSPGIPIGEVKIEDNQTKVKLFSDLSQVSFVNIDVENFERNE